MIIDKIIEILLLHINMVFNNGMVFTHFIYKCSNRFFYVGTGSGLGTYILDMLADEFPDVYR